MQKWYLPVRQAPKIPPLIYNKDDIYALESNLGGYEPRKFQLECKSSISKFEVLTCIYANKYPEKVLQ